MENTLIVKKNGKEYLTQRAMRSVFGGGKYMHQIPHTKRVEEYYYSPDQVARALERADKYKKVLEEAKKRGEREEVIELINNLLTGASVSSVADKANLSRQSVYKLLDKYK